MRDEDRNAGVEQLRIEVAHACHLLARCGLVVGPAGNVSACTGDLVAVTPTGGRLASLAAC